MVEQSKFTTYLNGQFIPHDQAVAALQAEETQAAGGYYDGERTFNQQVFRLRQHLERLFRGLSYSRIDPGLSMEDMEAIVLEVLDANRHLLGHNDEFSVTQVVNSTPGSSADERPKVNIVVFCQPLQFSAFAQSYRTGVRIVTPATYSVPERAVQTGVDGNGQRVYQLMTGSEGSITECVGANFMFIRGGRIKLPDRHNVLAGVSMQTVLELAESLGIAVDEDEYSTYDVYMAEEAFVSSTRPCMLPVATVNGLRLGDGVSGPVTGRLLDAWRQLVGMDFVQQALDQVSSDDSKPPRG
jgi:branched-chain amino acid aminotransferase